MERRFVRAVTIRGISFVLALLACWLPPACGSAGAPYVPQNDVVGAVSHYEIKPKETLYDVARRFDVGIVELLLSNPGVDPWMPKVGTGLIIPSAHVLPAGIRDGIVINLSALRLFYFSGSHAVMTFPVGIGMEGWATPTGATTIVRKRKDPVWIPPESIRHENPDLPKVVPAGPDNPMGAYALNLGWSGFAIHGTNRPYGIGKRSSHGCIRLYPEDIAALFRAVREGTPVTVIDMPYALGWRDNNLLLEVTPTQRQADVIARYKPLRLSDIPDVYYAVKRVAGKGARIDWRAVKDAVMWRTGIPVVVAAKNKGHRLND